MKQHFSIRYAFISSLAAITLFTSHARAVVIYVDDDAPPGGDGLTWNTAYTFLQDALALAAVPANQVTAIRIGQGEYKPDRDAAHPDGTGDRAASFQLVKNLLVAGGYAGYQAIDPDARSFVEFETILSGDLAGDDQPGFLNRGENSLHVLNGFRVDGAAIDGLTIVGGNADSAANSLDDRGSAFLLRDDDNLSTFTSFEMTNCSFRGNAALVFHAAVHVQSVDTIVISACQFTDNAARGINAYDTDCYIDHATFQGNQQGGIGAGGLLDVSDSVFQDNHGSGISGGHVELARCSFTGNSALRGAAVSSGYSQGSIVDCVFDSNTAEFGGAVYLHGDDTYIDDCTFVNNTATKDGGAAYVLSGSPTFENCRFESNSAVEGGGALVNIAEIGGGDYESCNSIIKQCTFVNNTAATGGAMLNKSAEPLVINCRFESNSATARGGAIASTGWFDSYDFGQLASRPRFYGCVLWDNESPKGGAIYSYVTFAKLVNCTIVGNRSTNSGAILSHSTASLRAYNSIIKSNDGGAFSGAGERTVRYSLIAGGHEGVGNIDANPRFKNSATGDLRLKSASKCIDAGRNLYLLGTILTDIGGQPRVHDDPATPDTGTGSRFVVDIGAYEF